jgi:hypothetical protein
VWNLDADARAGHKACDAADENNIARQDRPPRDMLHDRAVVDSPTQLPGSERAASSDRQGRHGDNRS